MLKKIIIKNEDSTSLKALLGNSTIVGLVGSGISIWEPTNLPSGKYFSDHLFSFLFRDNSGNSLLKNNDILSENLKPLPFEIINEQCPNQDKIKEILLRIYSQNNFNPIHELLANLLFERKIQSLITPNYDCCCDAAIDRIMRTNMNRSNKIIRIIDESDINTLQTSNDPIYFKIHGSTDDITGESLIFCMKQEGVLKPWKRSLFRKTLAGKTLLVIGYSGKDFDICPEILLARPNQILWNFYSEEEVESSINLNQLARDMDILALIGDMRELLGKLFLPISVESGQCAIDLEKEFATEFNVESRTLWRIRVYNCINFNKAALDETKKEISKTRSPNDQINFLSEHAGASASFGHYREAAISHDRATRIARINNLPQEIITNQLLLACDAWRCYGSFLLAWIRFLQAKRILKKNPSLPSYSHTFLNRNQILILRHFYSLFKKIHFSKLALRIQNTVKQLIPHMVDYYRENGEWYQLQQIELWRDRFGIDKSLTVYKSEYETPISKTGYEQLNFIMGRMMDFRHSLDNCKNLSVSDVKEARRYLSLAKDLGINPEVWKILHLIMFKAPKGMTSFSDFRTFIQYFFICQYSILFRVWRLVLGD